MVSLKTLIHLTAFQNDKWYDHQLPRPSSPQRPQSLLGYYLLFLCRSDKNQRIRFQLLPKDWIEWSRTRQSSADFQAIFQKLIDKENLNRPGLTLESVCEQASNAQGIYGFLSKASLAKLNPDLPLYSVSPKTIDFTWHVNPGPLPLDPSDEGYTNGPALRNNNCAIAAALQIGHLLQLFICQGGQIVDEDFDRWDSLYGTLRTIMTFNWKGRQLAINGFADKINERYRSYMQANQEGPYLPARAGAPYPNLSYLVVHLTLFQHSPEFLFTQYEALHCYPCNYTAAVQPIRRRQVNCLLNVMNSYRHGATLPFVEYLQNHFTSHKQPGADVICRRCEKPTTLRWVKIISDRPPLYLATDRLWNTELKLDDWRKFDASFFADRIPVRYLNAFYEWCMVEYTFKGFVHSEGDDAQHFIVIWMDPDRLTYRIFDPLRTQLRTNPQPREFLMAQKWNPTCVYFELQTIHPLHVDQSGCLHPKDNQ